MFGTGGNATGPTKDQFVTMLAGVISEYRRQYVNWLPPLARSPEAELAAHRALAEKALENHGYFAQHGSIAYAAVADALGSRFGLKRDASPSPLFAIAIGSSLVADWTPALEGLSDPRNRSLSSRMGGRSFDALKRSLQHEGFTEFAVAWARTDPYKLGKVALIAFLVEPTLPEEMSAPSAVGTGDEIVDFVNLHRRNNGGLVPLRYSEALVTLARELTRMVKDSEGRTLSQCLDDLFALGQLRPHGNVQVVSLPLRGGIGAGITAVAHSDAMRKAVTTPTFRTAGVHYGAGTAVLLVAES